MQLWSSTTRTSLLERLKENLPVQVFERRGMYNWGENVQECTLAFMVTAFGPVSNRNLSETDAALTKDNQPALFHEFNTWRVTDLPNRLVRDMGSSEVLHAPIIIREVGLDGHTDQLRYTEDKVHLTETILDKIFEINPGATIFLYASEFEAHHIVVWLSHRPRYHQRVVVLFYSFRYFGGDYVMEWVEKSQPARDLRQTIAPNKCFPSSTILAPARFTLFSIIPANALGGHRH